MLADDNQEEQNGFHSYIFLFSGFVLCAMVVLVALCGSNPKKYVLENYGQMITLSLFVLKVKCKPKTTPSCLV